MTGYQRWFTPSRRTTAYSCGSEYLGSGCASSSGDILSLECQDWLLKLPCPMKLSSARLLRHAKHCLGGRLHLSQDMLRILPRSLSLGTFHSEQNIADPVINHHGFQHSWRQHATTIKYMRWISIVLDLPRL